MITVMVGIVGPILILVAVAGGLRDAASENSERSTAKTASPLKASILSGIASAILDSKRGAGAPQFDSNSIGCVPNETAENSAAKITCGRSAMNDILLGR